MVPIQAITNPFNKPVEAVRPETTGAMASRMSQRATLASAGVTVPPSIFGSSGSSETSGSCACGSSGGGNTIAVA